MLVNHVMKKSMALLFAAGNLFLAGCCTTRQPASYDHVVYHDLSDGDLVKLGHEGWRVVGFTQDNSQGVPHTTTIMEKQSQ
jgi:hypothetical protein